MKTVCPSYQPTPNHAARTAALHARPCRIRPLSAFHKEPYFRTSQIVWDHLGSSERTARHSLGIAAMFARFRPPIRQKSTPCRVQIRPQTPVKKKAFQGLLGVVVISNYWPPNVAICNFPAFNSAFARMMLDARTAARAVAVHYVHHKNQMSRSADECQRTLILYRAAFSGRLLTSDVIRLPFLGVFESLC